MRKCDFCGEEYSEQDLERRMFAKGKVRYICYKCRGLGDDELHKCKIAGMFKKKIIGER